MILLDALLAGAAEEIAFDLPTDGEVGAALPLAATLSTRRGWPRRIEATLEGDPRLLPGGRADLALAPVSQARWHGEALCAPSRRGTGLIEQLWLRWTGPFGLGARQRRIPVEREVREIGRAHV